MSRRSLAYFIGILLLSICSFPIWIQQRGAARVYPEVAQVEQVPVAIIFGAGLRRDGTPSDALMDRLIMGANLYNNGKVDRLLVSGDNSTDQYNEPDAMKRSLIETFDVMEEHIFVDYAGRRTYDTCRRAHDLWGIENAILVTQGYHLPRAIWTCETLGIASTGISATLQPYIKEVPFKLREVAAIYNAFIDLYLNEPEFIGGPFIQDLDP